jgi:uncharacterized protein
MLFCRDISHNGCVMRIELDKLGKNGSAFAHAYQPEELAIDEEGVRLVRPPALKARIDRDGDQVRLKGSITAEAEVECDRCLKPIRIPVDAEFDVGYVPVTDYSADETPELHEEDLNVSVFDEEMIDIDDLAREQVLLAMPLRSLCREDCKGLCPVCGINKNVQACQCESTEVDPRWAALKDLRF